ncbi:MAG: phytoene/squalene synthase family protein [Bacteroidia bacterium]|nr:phytoene/squalene synthase family protein [Bacteroidia bacterium]
MDLYNNVCNQLSKRITWNYSTSFTLGIRTLHRSLHDPIYSIYGYVRLADEIVDTFHEFDKATLLKRFTQQTWEAIDEKINTNPILHSFQLVVHKYNIDRDLISAFLHSMEMDLFNHHYNTDAYNEYIYGSAEVVGLMCLKVFCQGNEEEYKRLKEPARKLGAAFQKVNFLRDMKSDFKERGRIYFPGVDFNIFNDHLKTEIEKEIEQDFAAAYKGIQQLPVEARFGVYVAYIYYQALLRKIKRLPAQSVRNERIRVPNKEKIALLFASWFRFRFNFL